MSRIATDIKYSLKQTFRNKAVVFWIFIFPIILFLIFGYIFGGQSDNITLYYQDNDGSQVSSALIQSINSTGAVELKEGSGKDLPQMLKDGKIPAYLEIPSGFGKNVATATSGSASSAGLPIYYDKSKPASMAAISIVQQVSNGFNMKTAGAKEIIAVNPQEAASSGMNYFDFLLPGILAIGVMSAVNMAVGSITRLRDNGVFRKLATTPFSNMEWIAARIINWTIIVILTLALAMFVAWLVFGINPHIDIITVLLVITGTALFSGLGIIIANYAKDGESAINATMAINFPLMFISNTFIPVDNLPWFLQYLAAISPLTYLSEGLRSSMITGNTGDALTNLAIIGVLGVALFGVGVAIFSWKED